MSNSPESLWANACAYFQWCDENPLRSKKTLTSGKEAGNKVTTRFNRPYTIKGLCLHCNISEEYLKDLNKSRDHGSEYSIVVKKILYIIYIQNLEYAMVGIFNPIFTAKILNIDVDDTPPETLKIEIVQGLPTLSRTESEVVQKLEIERGKVINREDENS